MLVRQIPHADEQFRNSSEENSERTAVIARCRNEERTGACGVAAKGEQRAMTASLEKGKAMSLRDGYRFSTQSHSLSGIIRDGKEAKMPLLRRPMQFEGTCHSRVAFEDNANSGVRVSAGPLY